jgi:hypothetical protein
LERVGLDVLGGVLTLPFLATRSDDYCKSMRNSGGKCGKPENPRIVKITFQEGFRRLGFTGPWPEGS